MADMNAPLVYKNEQPLFVLVLIISSVIWLFFIIVTFGGILVFILIGYIFYLFIQSAYISFIKGTAARISPDQFPDLHARVLACSEKLGIKNVPDAYLLHANGMFNALATRFLGRNFIILYSDIVDALVDHPDAINFYIGHELAHLKRRHLVWGPLLFPGAMLPLIGAGYSRARETTCDLHGAACCANPGDAHKGLAALAVGGKRWKSLDLDAYLEQAQGSRGFWMSFHELISDYPWLVKRMARISIGIDKVPVRNPLAWLLALFVPRLGSGANFLVVVWVIAVLAAVAIPSYQDYTIRARVSQGLADVSTAKNCVVEYYKKYRKPPSDNTSCGIPAPGKFSNNPFIDSISIHNGVITMTMSKEKLPRVAGTTMIFEPREDEKGNIFWLCTEGTLAAKYRPTSCR